jgi:hypothetical protein
MITEWIEHTGDECPVDEMALLDIEFNDGTVHKANAPAGAWSWTQVPGDKGINRYRIRGGFEPELDHTERKDHFIALCKAVYNGEKLYFNGRPLFTQPKIESLIEEGEKYSITPPPKTLADKVEDVFNNYLSFSDAGFKLGVRAAVLEVIKEHQDG